MRRRELLGGMVGLALGCGRKPTVDESALRGQGDPSPSPPPTPRGRTSVRVLSYNVLADEVGVDRRIPALMRTMERARPDVLALQEVAPWFMDWIADTDWLAQFELARIDGVPARPNGQLIASGGARFLRPGQFERPRPTSCPACESANRHEKLGQRRPATRPPLGHDRSDAKSFENRA